LPFQDSTPYLIGDAAITRSITEETEGLKIDVTATIKNNKRRIVGYFKAGTQPEESPVIHPPTAGSCANLEVNVQTDDISYQEYYDFFVTDGESWIIKERPWADGFTTYCQSGPGKWIDDDGDGDGRNERKWNCSGICPHFENFHRQLAFAGEYQAGDTVIIGKTAILDDDVDGRINCIVLNPPDDLDSVISGVSDKNICETVAAEGARILHECPESPSDDHLVTPPCQYTLQPGESGKIAVLTEDSIGVDRQPAVIAPSGEVIWIAEEKPEPGP
jgi:hypothetical protein